MSKVCFVDNDIFLKLVACDLFYEAISLLKLSILDLRVLPTAQKVIERNQKIKTRFSSNTRSNSINILNRCSKISIRPEYISEIKVLERQYNIDPGETLLLAATSVEKSFFLMTGDKRFLIALANNSKLDNFYKRIKGKVICLELLIYELIKRQDFVIIRNKIIPVRDCDSSLKACFGSGLKSEETTVLQNLKYYISELQKESKGILAEF